MNVFRAVLITGSPGIGKTTSAHLCAKLEGFTPIELNASDARSKKLVEVCTELTCPGRRSDGPSEQHQHHEHVLGRLDDWWECEYDSLVSCCT